MKQISFFSSAILFTCITIACNNNSSATNDKNNQQTSSDPASVSVSGSGSDMLYEYKITTSSSSNARDAMSIQGDTKMYISPKGKIRVEMNTTTSYQGKATSIPIVTIASSDKPNESVYIDDETKTYSVNHFADSEITQGLKKQTLSVTKIGEERIIGFNSVHARIVTKEFAGTYVEQVDTMDIWRSNAVPMIASVKALFNRFDSKLGSGLFTPDVVNQLKQMGCEGFMTKMEIHSGKSSTSEELIKVEHTDVPASKYQIPDGYKESKDGIGM